MQYNKYSNTEIFIYALTLCTVHKRHLTSSSLYQDSDSAVRTNQYSLAPPFMMLMLLMVNQPFLITCVKSKEKEKHTNMKSIIKTINMQNLSPSVSHNC